MANPTVEELEELNSKVNILITTISDQNILINEFLTEQNFLLNSIALGVAFILGFIMYSMLKSNFKNWGV